MEPLQSGTLTERPVSFPFSSGKTSAMAVALPVEVGDRLTMPDLPRRRSCFLPVSVMSTRVCVPVTLWMVVIMPCSILRFSWMTSTTTSPMPEPYLLSSSLLSSLSFSLASRLCCSSSFSPFSFSQVLQLCQPTVQMT